MTRGFAIYIALLGAAALAAITWPPIVVMGLFLGVIPGIVLSLSPSLFAYSLLWWSIRLVLLRIPTLARIPRVGWLRFLVPALSGAIIATPAILVPYLMKMRADDTAHVLQAGDRELE